MLQSVKDFAKLLPLLVNSTRGQNWHKITPHSYPYFLMLKDILIFIIFQKALTGIHHESSHPGSNMSWMSVSFKINPLIIFGQFSSVWNITNVLFFKKSIYTTWNPAHIWPVYLQVLADFFFPNSKYQYKVVCISKFFNNNFLPFNASYGLLPARQVLVNLIPWDVDTFQHMVSFVKVVGETNPSICRSNTILWLTF